MDSVAFRRPDGAISIVLLNRNREETYSIAIKTAKGNLNMDIAPKSFTSVVFNL